VGSRPSRLRQDRARRRPWSAAVRRALRARSSSPAWARVTVFERTIGSRTCCAGDTGLQDGKNPSDRGAQQLAAEGVRVPHRVLVGGPGRRGGRARPGVICLGKESITAGELIGGFDAIVLAGGPRRRVTCRCPPAARRHPTSRWSFTAAEPGRGGRRVPTSRRRPAGAWWVIGGGDTGSIASVPPTGKVRARDAIRTTAAAARDRGPADDLALWPGGGEAAPRPARTRGLSA